MMTRSAQTAGGAREADSPVRLFSPWRHRLFLIYLHRYFARHFRAVRTSGQHLPASGPLIVYSNHPGWWDPIHFGLLCQLTSPGRRLFGPMDGQALEKYSLFKKLGVFGVDPSPRGAARFVRIALEVLAEPGASLWLTAEGKFSDPRDRPVRLRPGLAHLVRRLEQATVVPLAVEYPFWDERDPEALSRFGDPLFVADGRSQTTEEWTKLFEAGLTETMDALAEDARSRDPRRFRTLVSGRVGVGGVYDRWRRFKAALAGRPFSAAHGDGA